MGLLDNLIFIWEAASYAIRDSLKEQPSSYTLASLFAKTTNFSELKIDISDWDPHGISLLLEDEVQLKMLARKFGEAMIEQPKLYQFILLTALYK
jgi:hypothetical protein